MEREDVIRIIKDELSSYRGINETPMRQICMEKANIIFDEKLAIHYKLYNLETQNLMLKIREEVKEDMSNLIKNMVKSNKDNVKWWVEIIKTILTILTVLGSIKIITI